MFEVLIDDAVDHGSSAKCAKVSRDIVCHKQHEVFRLAIQHDPLARVEHMVVWLHRNARVVRGNPSSDSTRLPWNAAVLPKPPPGDDDDSRRTWPGRVGSGGEHLGTGVGRVPVPRWASIEIIQGAAVEGRARKSGFMQWYFYVCDHVLVWEGSGILRYMFSVFFFKF